MVLRSHCLSRDTPEILAQDPVDRDPIVVPLEMDLTQDPAAANDDAGLVTGHNLVRI
jgi:hypothetical protein